MENRPCLHGGMRGPSVVRPGGWSMVHPLRPTDRPKAPIKQGLLQGRKEGRKGRLTFTGRSTVCGAAAAAAEEKMVINQFTTDSLAQFPFPSFPPSFGGVTTAVMILIRIPAQMEPLHSLQPPPPPTTPKQIFWHGYSSVRA